MTQKPPYWMVTVGNIGTVFHTQGRDAGDYAESVFRNYVEMSKAPFGRASGEEVTLTMNDSVVYWYNPETQDITCC